MFIAARCATGLPPTTTEIAERFDMHVSNASEIRRRLIERGALETDDRHNARSIRVIVPAIFVPLGRGPEA